jgi:RNA polymerase sigma factor (sigma-70 family)
MKQGKKKGLYWWVSTIGSNTALNNRIAEKRRRNRFTNLDLTRIGPDPIDKSSENPYVQYKISRVLGVALKELDYKSRVVINLFYYQDLSIEKISDYLGIRKPAVRSRLQRAKFKLLGKLVNQKTPRNKSEIERAQQKLSKLIYK